MKIIVHCLNRLCCLATFLFVVNSYADPVNRTPPDIYSQALEGELTALDSLLDQVDYFSPEESDHGCILQEDIVYVGADGRSYEVMQYAYKALSNGNLDSVGSGLYYFRPDTENIYLIKAETILPDGSRQEVPDEGILIQTLKSDRGSLIFSGRKQMRIIYPQVSEGSVTHCIVLIEKKESRIPGQFTDRYSWERSWQTHLKRVVINLPQTDHERLNIVSYGTGVPEVVESSLPGDRHRLEWSGEKLSVRRSEKCDGPILQTGPYLCLSTITNWNEFGSWYAGRIRESSVVNDEVKAIAEEWAEDAATEDEIIHDLAFHVANDIRYVSLEFRVGGLVPQPGASVLKNRFGDCKDKSNFLRMLLREHGIKSYVVLINTDHSGLVEKRCPHYAYFDHAILLIEKSNGEKVYCDPTVKYGSAGLLYPSIANRPALVVDDESSTCHWVEMPAASGGTLNYDWDLKLSDSGELSGWFTIKGEGFYGSSMSKRFQATNHDTLKNDVERYLGYFYGTSRVMDYEIQRAKSDDPTFTLKAYFVRSAAGQAERSVSWPDIKWLLPRLGEKKEVQREAFTWSKEIGLSLKIALPDSMSVEDLPGDWKVKTRGFDARGTWQNTDDVLQANFGFTVAESRYASQSFAKLFTAVDASSHWTEKLVILGAGNAPVAKGEPGEATATLGDEFVLLSMGKGQVDLIDHLYPLNSKPVQRKLALEQTKAWFPKDMPTQYECEIRLAWLAYTDKEYKACVGIVDEAIQNYGNSVDASLIGWGRYLKAMALEETERSDEALEIFQALEADPDMNEFRRGYSAYQYARMMAEQEPEVALEYYFKAYKYDSQNERWMLERSLPFLIKHASVDDVVSYLQQLNVQKADKTNSLIQWLAEIAKEGAGKLNGLEQASGIYQIITSLDFHASVLEEQQLAELKELDSNYKNYVACRKVIQAHLDGSGYDLWKGKPERERSFDDYTKDIQQAIDDSDFDRCTYLALARICYFSVEVEFPVWIWDAARMADYLCKQGQRELEPLRRVVFESRQYLPPKSDGTIDLDFIRAESFNREGLKKEALAVYQEMDDLQLEKRWLESMYRRWTTLLISEGNLAKAIQVFTHARTFIKEDEDFLPLSMLGIYALLQTGNQDEAIVWIDELHSECQELKLENEHAERLAAWAELKETGQLDSFWEFYNAWWPKWEAVRVAIDLSSTNLPASIYFTNPETAGEELGTAIADEDADEIAGILEQLIISARWNPFMCKEAQGVMSFLVDHYPDAEAELDECTVAMNCDRFLLDEDVKYSSRNDALNALLSLKDYDALLELVEVYFGDTTNDVYRNMHCRFAGLAVVNLDRPGTAWFDRMEEELQKPEQKNDPYAVNIMSRLYRIENRAQDERDLLHDYLTNHKADNATMNELLESRLKQIQELMNGNEQLSEAIAEWSATYELPWVSVFPEPKLDQDDLSEVSRTVEELLEPGVRLKLAQRVYLLHASRDDRLSSTVRENAFYKFLGSAIDPAWEYERALTMLETVIQDERFSESLRLRCANYGANLAYVFAVSGYIDQKFIPFMKELGLKDRIEKGIELKAKFCDRDPLSASSISEWMNLAKEGLQPFNRHSVYLLNLAFSDLCELGAMKEVQEQIGNAKKFRFETSAGSSSFSLQLKWRQQADQLKEFSPIHDAFAQFYMEKIKPELDQPRHADILAYERKGLDEQARIYRSLLQHKLYDHSSLRFWTQINDLEYLNGTICVDRNNLAALMDDLLKACDEDSQFNAALDLVAKMFDSDDAECQRIFLSKAKDITMQPGMDKTKQMVLEFEYNVRIRGGDHKSALVDLESEKNISKRQRHIQMLKALAMSQDRNAMNIYLNSASTDLLLDDYMISETLYAYKLCDNEAAYELVAERGEEVFLEFMAKSAQMGDKYSIYYAVLLAEHLGKPDSLDDKWIGVVDKIGRKDVVENMLMRSSNLKEDWSTMETSARTVSKLKPSHYDTFYFLGKSLIKQGKYNDGAEALKPFLRYCLDSKHYRDAVELNEYAKSHSEQ